MRKPIQIIKTKDGSDTLFVPELAEHYHSVNGALTESLHVFIEVGLKFVLQRYSKKLLTETLTELTILEIGFGTGLNALLTCLEGQKYKNLSIRYSGIELYPLPEEIINRLDFSLPEEHKSLFQKIHACRWNEYVAISDNFFLNKRQADFTQEMDFAEKYDLVYFDAFAPDIQPEMWSLEIFNRLYGTMSTNAVLTTYCAKGQVRRNMQTVGFTTERLSGPPGKREMLRAVKNNY